MRARTIRTGQARVSSLVALAVLAGPVRAGVTAVPTPTSVDDPLGVQAEKLARTPPPCASDGEGTARALLVGDESLPFKQKLNGPLNDLKLLGSALVRAGVPEKNVESLANPSPADVARKLRAVLDDTRCRDRVFLYYGGYANSENAGGAIPLLKLSTLRMVVNAMRNAGAAVIVVIDAPLERGFLGFEDPWLGPGLWTPSSTIPPVLPGAGSLVAFYAPVSRETIIEGRPQGVLSFAMATVIGARPDAAVREIADGVRTLVRKTSPDVELRVEASHPLRPLLRTPSKPARFAVIIDEPPPPPGGRGERGGTPVKVEEVPVKGHIEPAVPLSWVTIQGERASLSAGNRFERNVKLAPGLNTLWVQAAVKSAEGEDPVPISTAIDVTYERPAKPRGRSYALLIGEQRYEQLTALKTPENDVSELARVLKEEYGFETEELTLKNKTRQRLTLVNQDRASIVSALYALYEIPEEDSILIYFAGHGVPDGARAYWKSVKAGPSLDAESIGTGELHDIVVGLQARHVLVVADSCYAGLMTGVRFDDKRSEAASTKGRRDYLDDLGSRRSREILVSGQNQPVDDEKGGDHSIFAATLLDALRTMEQPEFTARELFEEKKIQERVRGNANQLPDLSAFPESKHDAGRFIFVRKAKVP